MKIMMVAGEASGDLLGAQLLHGLHTRFPSLQAEGVGGPAMQQAGLVSRHDFRRLSIVGLLEVGRALPSLVGIFRDLLSWMRRERPLLLVTIDLPDFNFLLGRLAKRAGIPVVHYVSPQVWAWRPGRVHSLARFLDHLLVLYPFEPRWYENTTLPVHFVGHPLLKWAVPSRPREVIRAELGLEEGQELVVVLPGSRHGEIRRMLPVLARSCRLLRERRPRVRCVGALAATLTEGDIRQFWPAECGEPIPFYAGRTYDLLAAGDAGLITSGTASLEAACLGLPMVVAYRVNALTYQIGLRLIKTPFISLVNLILGEGVVPERIQNEANPERLAQDVERFLADPVGTSLTKEAFARMRHRLESPDCNAVDVVGNIMAGLTNKER
ncbi:MAG: lipid-A-disaccharide synthase [Magnetococcales bacterium]|nr:lipid-A-disaccharide synthase [Magnetococcales bacterium]